METQLENLLHGLRVEADTLISPSGDATIGFEVAHPEIYVSGIQAFEHFHQTLIKAFKVLPVHTIYHQQDYFTEEKYEGDFKSASSFLTQRNEKHFHERAHLHHRCFIFLTLPADSKQKQRTFLSLLLRQHLIPLKNRTESAWLAFENAVGQFLSILQTEGHLSLRRLTDQDWMSDVFTAGILEQYCLLNLQHDRIAVKDICFKPEFKIGDQCCKLYTFTDPLHLPAYTAPRINDERLSTEQSKASVGFATALGLLLRCNHIYNQYIFLQDIQQTVKNLDRKRLRLQSLSAYSRDNVYAKEGTTDFLNEIVQHQRIPVKAHYNLLVFADTHEALKLADQRVFAAAAKIDAKPKTESFGAPALWLAGIPGMEAYFPMHDACHLLLEQACCLLHQETNYRSSSGYIGLRLADRLSGKPLLVDLSDEPMRKGIIANRNKFILGPSGSGKSFFTNHMVRSYYEQGTHVVIVDVGHSYQGLCSLVNGYYFSYREREKIAFNPFYTGQESMPDTEKKESIKTLLIALWKKDDEAFSRSEYVALSNALQAYFEREKGFRSFNGFYEFLQNDFMDLLKTEQVKEKDFDIHNFLYVLKPYYKGGEYAYLLNATDNIDLLDKPFIVFELDSIKDHPILFPVVTIVIMEVFISKMRKLQGVRKMILIEEAWKAIAKAGMAGYIQYLFKTVRKFYGEAIVVTQEIDDIISSEIVKRTIINSSDCKILLDQHKYQNCFEEIQKLLGLSDQEKVQVLSLNKGRDPSGNYKEVFISLGGACSKVYRTEVSLEEYLTYTTEEKEKIQVMDYADTHGGMEAGIKALAREMKGSKVITT